MNKAVVPQVLKLGTKYQIWVHKNQSAIRGFRIFQYSFFENLSQYPWWYIFMWIPVILYSFWMSLKIGIPLLVAILCFPIGSFIWTGLEYVIHRYIFHMYTFTPFWNFIHFLLHGIHHLTPTDPYRLTFPPVFSVVTVYAIYRIVILIIPHGYVQAMFSGGLFGYMMYDTMHYYFHHDYIPWAPYYFKWMKTRHLEHHFKNENRNYGVTNPIWDYICGTSYHD